MYIKIFGSIVLALVAISGAAASGLLSKTSDDCSSMVARPCYDKTTKAKTDVLGKNADKPFAACLNNSAPNDHGTASMRTSVCGDEQYTFCFDGKSKEQLRWFDGLCNSPPPPPPPPPAAICSDKVDNDGDGLIDYPHDPGCTSADDSDETNVVAPPPPTTFRVLAPNGGEALAFGSTFPLRWEGADASSRIELDLVKGDGSVVLRRFASGLVNDGSEDWVTDVPLGSYMLYAEACQDVNCTNKMWDYSDNPFSVVAGAPIAKVASANATNASLVVLSASGGESWQAGTTHKIVWSGGSVGTSTIQIQLVNATTNTTVLPIASNVANSGEYQWIIPKVTPAGLYTIYISCSSQTCAGQNSIGWYATSYKPFTITATTATSTATSTPI